MYDAAPPDFQVAAADLQAKHGKVGGGTRHAGVPLRTCLSLGGWPGVPALPSSSPSCPRLPYSPTVSPPLPLPCPPPRRLQTSQRRYVLLVLWMVRLGVGSVPAKSIVDASRRLAAS